VCSSRAGSRRPGSQTSERGSELALYGRGQAAAGPDGCQQQLQQWQTPVSLRRCACACVYLCLCPWPALCLCLCPAWHRQILGRSATHRARRNRIGSFHFRYGLLTAMVSHRTVAVLESDSQSADWRWGCEARRARRACLAAWLAAPAPSCVSWSRRRDHSPVSSSSTGASVCSAVGVVEQRGGVRGRRAIIWLAQGSVPQRVPTERPGGGLGFTWQVVVLPSAAQSAHWQPVFHVVV
jgi:hypothetical protein